MRQFVGKLVLFSFAILIVLCSCRPQADKVPADVAAAKPVVEAEKVAPKPVVEVEKPAPKSADETEKAAAKPAIPPQKPKEQVTAPPPRAESADIVAEIGDYRLTKQELEQRFMQEIRFYGGREFPGQAKPGDVKTTLLRMIAEKAMVMESRRQGLLEDEDIKSYVERFLERRLVGMLLQKCLGGKVNVVDAEVEMMLKANPKLDRVRAKAMLESAKAKKLLDQYYNELYKKFNIEKKSENFSDAVNIHRRLLLLPKMQRDMPFIRTAQVKNELTQEEKDLVLATGDFGRITLKDWFMALTDMAPPGRPKDLNTVEGVEKLLDRALKRPVFAYEAKLQGLDKDEDLLKWLREQEDMRLLVKARGEKVKDVPEPNDEQITAYFNDNKEKFRRGKMVKIDLIWCEDLKTAEKVKAELDEGKDFQELKQQHSLNKQQTEPYAAYPDGEGVFFADLYKADPNDIVGPIKGFYPNGIKWRVVKVIEKKQGDIPELTDNVKNGAKWRLVSESREAILKEYGEELRKKYPYKIYEDALKSVNPLDIP